MKKFFFKFRHNNKQLESINFPTCHRIKLITLVFRIIYLGYNPMIYQTSKYANINRQNQFNNNNNNNKNKNKKNKKKKESC